MQYAMLIYEPAVAFESRDRERTDPHLEAWAAYHRALLEAGVYVGGEPLRAADDASTVRLRDGRCQIQDGPYAESKEQLGGFIILELPSLDAALEWAARCPAVSAGAIEVRPLASDFKRRMGEWAEGMTGRPVGDRVMVRRKP